MILHKHKITKLDTTLILSVQKLGKRFNRHWIFRGIDKEFTSGKAYAITGSNGSGKSTLLQVLAGAMQHSEGTINIIDFKISEDGKAVLPENHYQHISLATPYLELIEELTLQEFLRFHFSYKPIVSGQTIKRIIDYIGLQAAANQQIRYYSSGMKQRVKLAQAIFSDTQIVLLDEPTTNLDTAGINLYHELVQQFCKNRLLIVCSNDENEISFCDERLDMANYK